MRSLNYVSLIGNLTRDPELRATSSGKEVCRFSLALSWSFNNSDGEKQEGVDFVDISAWDGLASIVNNYCHKGKQIAVQGRLKTSSWEQDGETRRKLEVIAKDIILLGGRSSADGQEAPKSKSSPQKDSTVDYEADQDFEDHFDEADIPF